MFLIVISDLSSFAHSEIYIDAESFIDEISPCDSAIPIRKLVNDLALDQEEESASPLDFDSPSEDGPATCAGLGGECVFRCDTEIHDCLQGALCVANANLTVVDV